MTDKDKKDLPKATAAPTLEVVAFTTMGDSRVLSKPHAMSTLFELVAKELGATRTFSVPNSYDATKKIEAIFPPVSAGKEKSEKAPPRVIKRVMFVGHGGPQTGGDYWAFSGSPPPNNDPHNFIMPVIKCLDDASVQTGILLDALAERLVDGAQIWFVSCYNGQTLAGRVLKRLKAVKAPNPWVRAYTKEVGFRWLPGTPGKAQVLVDSPLGPLLVTPNQPRFDYEGT